jgi:hypothetical protein
MDSRDIAGNRLRRSCVRWSRRIRLGLFLACLATGIAVPRLAHAQRIQSRLQNDFGDLLRILTELSTQIGNKSRGELLSFLNKIELFNVESEIDRLVGSPWELNDSTSYKLSLAPLHIAYPVFDQQVQQITRLDDIRSRRIQDLTVDSLGLITVNLDVLNTGTLDINNQRTGGELASSILHYFNAREFLDLGVFLLAQQPYFPQTPEAWDDTRHQLGTHRGLLALTATGLGALFEVGALNNSGTIRRCQGNACAVGWYGGFSHLGYHLQPNVRGGLTTRLPWLEVSAGLREQVRPAADGAASVFEAAVRESWLTRYTAVAGWDSFFEAAARRVLSAESRYQGESFTARGGLFVKREHPFRWRYITLRGSTEVESDLTGSLRYALGLGVDYSKTGLSAVLQSSRTNVVFDGASTPENRTGIFIAGTVEAPEQYFVEAMQVQARRLREAWNHLVESEAERRQAEAELRVLATGTAGASRMAPVVEALRRASAESEAHRLRVATLLGDYLERRRLAYSLKQWPRSPDDLHGPLDGEVLVAAAAAVFTRLAELTLFLRGAEGSLATLRERGSRIAEAAQAAGPGAAGLKARAADELAAVDRDWRQASESVTDALRLYERYLASVRRIANLSGGLVPVRHYEPLGQRRLRKLLTLVAQPL